MRFLFRFTQDCIAEYGTLPYNFSMLGFTFRKKTKQKINRYIMSAAVHSSRAFSEQNGSSSLIFKKCTYKKVNVGSYTKLLQEENIILERMNRHIVLEVEKLVQIVCKREEVVLAGGAAANAMRDYKRRLQEVNEKDQAEDKQIHYECRCSFLEIYNEQIGDLLDLTQRNLENLSEEYVTVYEDVTQIMIKGTNSKHFSRIPRTREGNYEVVYLALCSKTFTSKVTIFRPPILEKGNYISWECRFRRFLDNQLEEGERMWNSIQHGPYQRPIDPNPDILGDQILEPLSKMTEGDKKKYIADVRVMNCILQAIPNDIYNSVDACENAKDMWERIKRLMHGSDITTNVRHSRLMDEFDKFAAKEGESLDSVYERLTTLVNIMDCNNVRPITVAINTKFLNCLQPKWSKYFTMVRQNQADKAISYDVLYDSLVQFEPHVLASRAKKAAKNHDSLALIAHSNASSSSHPHANSSYSPQSYYVTHTPSVVDYDDEYQGELQGDSQEDKLTTGMMLLA
ncbi:reverse transcriptase domain-containing protein [Tanacetum coccineum]|uniref:Reverse transcriptase domain-containing protein n=1 Tax=Tanacetum coccineum TaxID=301880 RepID=A0ABQ4YZP0_9ASTR